jgi:hypothetical protein
VASVLPTFSGVEVAVAVLRTGRRKYVVDSAVLHTQPSSTFKRRRGQQREANAQRRREWRQCVNLFLGDVHRCASLDDRRGPRVRVGGENVLHFPRKLSYTLPVEIVIRSSARAHLIVDEETRAVITYPVLRVGLAPRRANTTPVLFIGPAADNQPWIEVIADLLDPEVAEVFHAMMLRPGLVARLGLDALVDPDYGPQRA